MLMMGVMRGVIFGGAFPSMLDDRSFMSIRNRSGPRMDPCGTPVSVMRIVDVVTTTTTAPSSDPEQFF